MDNEFSETPPHDDLSVEHSSSLREEEKEHEGSFETSKGDKKLQLPQEFLEEMDRLGTAEEKLDRAILFMQEILEGGGSRQFREFWEVRRLCLELFQTSIHPTARVRLWTRYSELCREARRLKELFEEQSSFVTEQIEKAIDAVEEDFASLDTKLSEMPQIEALEACRSINHHLDQYQTLQHELNYLNSFASRVSGLRKELLKAEIRYKQKARLLERLRVLGDWIYPRRKDSIGKVSLLFLADVEAFIQATFVGELKTHELFEIREEIKSLQSVGKVLTLSTEAFTRTRQQLSECWDSIKTVLKEKKKAQSEQRQVFKQHRDEIMASLDALKAGVEAGTMKTEEAWSQLRRIDTTLHSVSLGHQDVRLTGEKTREVRSLLEQKWPAPEKKIPQDRKGLKYKAQEFSSRSKELLESSLGLKEIEEAYRSLVHDISGASLSKSGRLELDQIIAKIREKIEELRKEYLAHVSTEEEIREGISALEHIRFDIKHQLEVWRKTSGGFGYDFAEGLQYQELADSERSRLERVEAMIEDFESRLLLFQEDRSESCP